MKSSGRNINLTSYDDIFSTEETRQGGHEQIQHMLLTDLVPFKDHPFRVLDDDKMMETVESVKEYGVLVPDRAAIGGRKLRDYLRAPQETRLRAGRDRGDSGHCP